MIVVGRFARVSMMVCVCMACACSGSSDKAKQSEGDAKVRDDKAARGDAAVSADAGRSDHKGVDDGGMGKGDAEDAAVQTGGSDTGGTGGSVGAGAGSTSANQDEDAGKTGTIVPPAVVPCLSGGGSRDVPAARADKVDLLFVVDSSLSMIDEQEKLKEQIPLLVQTLASGVRNDGTTFPATQDMHLGVVTTDMGVPGGNLPDTYNCNRYGGYGDDGILRTSPGAPYQDTNVTWAPDPSCGASYPNFIFFDALAGDDPAAKAADLGCLAQVGPGGCGYEMQLEAALKALWPALDIDPMTGNQWIDPITGLPSNRYTFLTAPADVNTNHRFGHGDGANAGFLRSDLEEGVSVIAVILVTDEDDCSSKTVDHLRMVSDPLVAPEVIAPANGVPVNLRCLDPSLDKYLEETSRYVEGLRALRPGNENLVIFGAITGVPPTLVNTTTLSGIDFTDPAARRAYYESIRNDANMQIRLNGTGDNIEVACTSASDPSGGAYPAHRILDVVEGFGQNGIIQSICEDNFEAATNLFINIITRQIGAPVYGSLSVIGSSCDGPDQAARDAICAGGLTSSPYFCHPRLNVCVQSCSTDLECPLGWICDDQPEMTDPIVGAGEPICVNPNCE